MNFTKTLMETITSLNMNNQTALREQLEKVVAKAINHGYGDCVNGITEPTEACKLEANTHIDELMALIDTAVQQAVPEKMEHGWGCAYESSNDLRCYCTCGANEANDILDLFQSNWEKVKKGEI